MNSDSTDVVKNISVRLESVCALLRYACDYHTLTNFNTTATISGIDVRHNPRKRRVPQHGQYSPQTAACSFSLSRGSRVWRVPTRPARGETGRHSLGLRRPQLREFDAIRRSPDPLTRITRPPRGLPVRGWGTRDCRLSSSSSSSASQRQASELDEARGSLVYVRS